MHSSQPLSLPPPLLASRAHPSLSSLSCLLSFIHSPKSSLPLHPAFFLLAAISLSHLLARPKRAARADPVGFAANTAIQLHLETECILVLGCDPGISEPLTPLFCCLEEGEGNIKKPFLNILRQDKEPWVVLVNLIPFYCITKFSFSLLLQQGPTSNTLLSLKFLSLVWSC